MQAGSNCWMFTQTGCLMPCKFVGEVYSPRGMAFCEVKSSAGKIYTCNPANVFDDETGRAMLIQRRAEGLVREGYQLSFRADGTFRIYHPEKHGVTGGYILREIIPGHLRCSCPAYEAHGQCKHQFGVCGLLYAKASAADRAGKTQQADTCRTFARCINDGLALIETQQPKPGGFTAERREAFARRVEADFP